MGCRLSALPGLRKRVGDSRGQNWQPNLRFAAADVAEIQGVLWDMLTVEGKDRKRSAEDLRRMVGEIRDSAAEMQWVVPEVGELASRLLVDVVDREEAGWDCHVVRQLETEEQVMELIFDAGAGPSGGTVALKPAALEILVQWYVHTEDCESNVRGAEGAEGADGGRAPNSAGSTEATSSYLQSAEEEERQHDGDGSRCEVATASSHDGAPHDSIQSFVWKGSLDVDKGSFCAAARGGGADPRRSFAASLPRAGAPLSLSTPLLRATTDPAAGPDAGSAPPSPRPDEPAAPPYCCSRSAVSRAPPYAAADFAGALAAGPAAPYLERLCLVLHAAMRAALRHYSTSHYDDDAYHQRSASQLVAGREWSRDRKSNTERVRDMARVPGLLAIRPRDREYTLTVVLDLDETLVFAREGPLWVRPGVRQFLSELCGLGCEVVAWTASNRCYAGGILSRIDPAAEFVSQCIYAHAKWQRRPGQSYPATVKNLSLIGRDLDRTIIVDNLPDAVAGSEMNAIVVENYEGCELHDRTLSTLTKVIRDLVESGMAVPTYLSDTRGGGHLKFCEQRLVSGEATWCFVLNSEPDDFSMLL